MKKMQSRYSRAFMRVWQYRASLLRPSLWPELGRRFARWRNPAPTADVAAQVAIRREAWAWCEARAVGAEEGLRRLTVTESDSGGFQEIFAPELTAATERIRRSELDLDRARLGGAANLHLLYALCESTEARSVLETGVAYGWSSLAILLSLRNREGSRLFSVDLPYLHLGTGSWVGIAVPEYLRDCWTLYRMADREGIPRAIRAAGAFDLAHYDSDKSYEGRLWGYERIWNALRPGGLLVSDDIDDDFGFCDFCERVGADPVVIRGKDKFQGVISKPVRA